MNESLRSHNGIQLEQGHVVSLIGGSRRGFVEHIDHLSLHLDGSNGRPRRYPVRVRWMTLTDPARDPLYQNPTRTFHYFPRELVVQG